MARHLLISSFLHAVILVLVLTLPVFSDGSFQGSGYIEVSIAGPPAEPSPVQKTVNQTRRMPAKSKALTERKLLSLPEQEVREAASVPSEDKPEPAADKEPLVPPAAKAEPKPEITQAKEDVAKPEPPQIEPPKETPPPVLQAKAEAPVQHATPKSEPEGLRITEDKPAGKIPSHTKNEKEIVASTEKSEPAQTNKQSVSEKEKPLQANDIKTDNPSPSALAKAATSAENKNQVGDSGAQAEKTKEKTSAKKSGARNKGKSASTKSHDSSAANAGPSTPGQAAAPAAPAQSPAGGNGTSEKPGGLQTDQTGNKDHTENQSKPKVGVPVPPLVLPNDIKIDISCEQKGLSGLSVRLMKRPHEQAGEKLSRSTQSVVEMKENSVEADNKFTKTYSVVNASKGVYVITIENPGNEELSLTASFSLYGGSKKEKKKAYPELKIASRSQVRIKFILPESLFWDDDESFSGNIEDSTSVSKFLFGSDLIWREDKNR